MTLAVAVPAGVRAKKRLSLRQVGTVTLLFVVTLAPLIVFLWEPGHRVPVGLNRQTALQVFAIWVLAFLPAWLFVRFLTARGPALWHEYVVHLHRLGVDRRGFLPEPPSDSEYHALWIDDRTATQASTRTVPKNLYKEKFDAYYGRDLSSAFEEAAIDADPRVSAETMFPVILTAAVFAVGWSTLFSSPALPPDGDLEAGDVMVFSFAGAYLFNLHTLVRRYFQTDLRASAYASAVVRVISGVLVARVVYELPVVADLSEGMGRAVAFMVGFFPLAGLHALRRASAKALGSAVQSLRSRYPLSDVQGMNLWYEARLVEEGIEDMQELVTANVVDIILHTRVPVSRLVDWLDQARLLLYLEPKTEEPDGGGGKSMRAVLQGWGITKASTFLAAFGPYRPVDNVAVRERAALGKAGTIDADSGGGDTSSSDRDCGPWEPDSRARAFADLVCASAPGWQPDVLLTLVRVIANDTSLTPVLNWHDWGARRMYELQRGLTENR